jgi:hypothetical protein
MRGAWRRNGGRRVRHTDSDQPRFGQRRYMMGKRRQL